jgi:hypothetical protein
LRFQIDGDREVINGKIAALKRKASCLVPLARAGDMSYRMQEGRCCGARAALAESGKLKLKLLHLSAGGGDAVDVN